MCIHMNGRVYDYNLGRFLSVDPFIQEPGNSQSMNPYSYIMNNPLAGTDPTGYLCESADSGAKCEFDQGDIEKYTVYEDKNGEKFTVAEAKNGDTFKVESMTMTTNGAGDRSFSDVGGRITVEELGSIKDMNKTTFGDVVKEGFSPDNIKEQSEQFRVDGNAFSNFLVDMTNDTVDGYAGTVEDAQNGDFTSAAVSGALVATKLNKIIPKKFRGKAKEFFRVSKGTNKSLDNALSKYNKNDIHHLFGRGGGAPTKLLNKYGSPEAALRELQKAAQTVTKNYQTGAWIPVKVGDIPVTIKGKVIDGVFRISSIAKREF